MSKKRSHASPEVGTEQKPKRRADRRQEVYSSLGPSTITAQPPTSMQHLRPVLPKPAFTPPKGNPSVHFEAQVFREQLPQDQQSPGEPPPCTTLSQEDTLLQSPEAIMHTVTANESASIPSFPHTSIQRVESQPMFGPISADAHIVSRNETANLNLFGQISPHSPTTWGHCVFCDGLWRSHTESVMGLLRPPGAGTAGYGVDSTPPTWNIFKSYFAFQDHAERCHGWRISE